MDFTSKTALITGAAVGIGRAVALELAKNRSDLVLFDINEEPLAKLAEELRQYNIKCKTYVCDVSNEEQVNNPLKMRLCVLEKLIYWLTMLRCEDVGRNF